MKAPFFSFLIFLTSTVVAQNTSTNVNFGFNYNETNSTNTNVGVGVSVTETQSPPPTQVIVVHEVVTAPAPAPVNNCAVSGQEMGNILESIRNKTFADSQQSQAKTIIKNKCFTSQQIKQIMNVFTFEDSKLEIAKFAYAFVLDPNNYYEVNDAFEFSSSSDELNEYISGN